MCFKYIEMIIGPVHKSACISTTMQVDITVFNSLLVQVCLNTHHISFLCSFHNAFIS